jgi:excisionase family DNA binding protein
MRSSVIALSADGLLRVHNVAKRLGVPRRTVRHWAATGVLRAHKHGPKIWVFDPRDVEAFRLARQGAARIGTASVGDNVAVSREA